MDEDRFGPCAHCGQIIATDLSRCPYCREATGVLPPPPPPPVPPPPPPSGRLPSKARRTWWLEAAAAVIVASAALAVFLVSGGGGGQETTCSLMSGETPVVQYALLVEGAAAPSAPSGWEEYLDQTRRECPELIAPIFEARPGLAGPPPRVWWHVGEEVPSWEEEKAGEMVTRAQAMLAWYAGESLPALTVYMDTERATLARVLGGPYEEASALLGEGIWFGGSGAIVVNLSQQALRYPYDYETVAHEVMHVFQTALAHTEGSPPAPQCPVEPAGIDAEGPRWLVEGIATRVGVTALVESPYWPVPGYSDDPRFLHESVIAVGYGTVTDPLSTLASAEGWEAQDAEGAYSLAYAAAALLEERAGRDSLFAYFRDLGTGDCWEAAFATTFGITPDDFYGLFEAQRPQPEGG